MKLKLLFVMLIGLLCQNSSFAQSYFLHQQFNISSFTSIDLGMPIIPVSAVSFSQDFKIPVKSPQFFLLLYNQHFCINFWNEK